MIIIRKTLAPPGAAAVVPVLLALGLAAAVLAAVGPVLLADWARGDLDAVRRLTLVEVRLPRVLLGVLAGAALGVAGTLMQDGLRNPLAGPELLGVASGGALVAATIAVLGLAVPLALQSLVVLLGAGAAGLVLALAAGSARDATRLLLVGAALSSVLAGLVVAVVSLGTAGDVDLLLRYLLGSLAGRTWDHVLVTAVLAVPALVAALLLRRALGVLALGETVATGLGARPGRLRLGVLTAALALTAAVVATCGPVAFVALVAPHLVRRLRRTSVSAVVVPLAGLVGALLVVVADLLARTALAPVEVPVGVTTTVVGVPVLLVLLRRDEW